MADPPYKSGGILMPYQPELHLFTIMNDPCPEKHCLVVMVTSIKAGRVHDSTCILNIGDHPFVKKPSYMLYRMAETIGAEKIQTRLNQKYYLSREDFDPQVFGRIANGLHDSDETRGRIRTYALQNHI